MLSPLCVVLITTNKLMEEKGMSTPYNRTIKAIVIHHPGDGKSPDVSILSRWNPYKYDYPEYDFAVEADGTIRVGRPLNIQGSHCIATKAPYSQRGGNQWWNQNSIGVVVTGDFTKFPMGLVQFTALCDLIKRLMDEHGLTLDNVYPHNQVANTACPGCVYSKVAGSRGYWNYDEFESAMKNPQIPIVVQPIPVPHVEPSRSEPITIVNAPVNHVEAPVQQETERHFSYPNNAKCTAKLPVKDANGNLSEGHFVSAGDIVTVINVSYSRGLIELEYPVGSNQVRSGFVSVSSNIVYLSQGAWHNGSTTEIMYNEANKNLKIGSLSPYEKATPLYKKNGFVHLVYNTDKGSNSKSAYSAYMGGL
ncbi:MAG TPA: peptidoglycan recognition family protein [Clostridium sp.]|uniref:peptidoglycan recognition protein family protein n=1 Tax=Clostridium sp. TaxID=1506 RepID=UPI002F951769